ncbi:aminotransferase class I/II-fold pyridoxal phosphate-dependent enzyme [Sphingobium sp. H39-3-25]|uniref:aminotransferase class I/II-fold pyridoxal phosphate-dependent enzyme n=1 Tax=Sphingobium arseniciresistens TaxID=3030834 RepID=UPI0023B88CCF|nr:aminotransferase class I/II-fold pyridoxal phosphate-dependent enzyme [Sphingobium arseniciresistens]
MTGLAHSPWTFHGGRVEDARVRYGGARWLDLSTGINPHAWPTESLLPVDWRALPDENALKAMEEAAADYFGLSPRHLCAVPGTEIGLRLLGQLLPGPAAHVAPCYRTHGEMFAQSMVTDASGIGDHLGTLILANPNNPDGREIAPDRLIARIDAPQTAGHWLIVDEAFTDTSPDISLASAVDNDRRLVICRSFGKFFGLAGVRLGFILGPESLIAQLRATLGAWPISAAAIAIGHAAYGDRSWIAAMRERLHADAAALDAVLLRHGLSPIGACPLFRLIETPDAMALFDRLARRAILTRPFDSHPRWLRLGLPGSPEALARLDEALRESLRHG